MFNRNRLLDVLRFAQQQEIAFIDRLSEAQRDAASAPDHWSAKDTIAHLAAWKQRLLDRLQGAPRDQRPDDPINAEIYEAHRAKTWGEVRALAEAAYQRTVEYVRAAPERDLTDAARSVHEDGRPPWVALLAQNVSHAMAHLWEYHLQHGEPDRAVTLQEATTAQLREMDDPAVYGFGVYNLACVYARAGRPQDAIRALGEALRLRPELAEWSKQDPDLDSLRDAPGYRALYA